jgi:hypothetical protein
MIQYEARFGSAAGPDSGRGISRRESEHAADSLFAGRFILIQEEVPECPATRCRGIPGNKMDSDSNSGVFPKGNRRANPDMEYRRILTAMRLLAGSGVERDAVAASQMLNELCFSASGEIADDARSLLAVGAAMRWFEDVVPTMSDLLSKAGTSVRFYRSWRNRLRVARILSLLVFGLLILLLWLNLPQGGVATEWESLTLILLALSVLIAANWICCR